MKETKLSQLKERLYRAWKRIEEQKVFKQQFKTLNYVNGALVLVVALFCIFYFHSEITSILLVIFGATWAVSNAYTGWKALHIPEPKLRKRLVIYNVGSMCCGCSVFLIFGISYLSLPFMLLGGLFCLLCLDIATVMFLYWVITLFKD